MLHTGPGELTRCPEAERDGLKLRWLMGWAGKPKLATTLSILFVIGEHRSVQFGFCRFDKTESNKQDIEPNEPTEFDLVWLIRLMLYISFNTVFLNF